MGAEIGLAIQGDMTRESAGKIVELIAQAGQKEAVGLLWRGPGEPEIVVALDNISDEPESSYAVRVDKMIDAFQAAYGEEDVYEIDWSCLTLWHSHPSGAVGPSRGDMQTKLPELRYMVIAMTDAGPVVTEF